MKEPFELEGIRTNPGARVVSDESNVDGASSRYNNRISSHGVGGALRMGRIESGVIGGYVRRNSNDLILVTMEMDYFSLTSEFFLC